MLSYFKSIFNKSPFIALDRGWNELRLLQLKKQGSSYSIEKMQVQALPVSKASLEKSLGWERVEKELGDLAQQVSLPSARVIVALPHSWVLKKQIEFPWSSNENEWPDELKQRLPQYFPGLPADDLFFDYTSRPSRNEHSAGLLLAARKSVLEAQAAIFKKAGLQLQIADIDVYALARAAAWHFFQNRPDRGEVLALFHLSWPLSSFLVLNRKDLLFYHQWCLEPAVFEENPSSSSTLSQSLKTAWQLYLATHPSQRPCFLGLSGDFPGLSSLPSLLQDFFPLPLELLKPFESLSYSSPLSAERVSSLSSRFFLSLGLALRGAEQ